MTCHISKDNLDVIKDLGDKKTKVQFTDDKWHWENQNYLFHFYASCLLASANLRGKSSNDKKQAVMKNTL